MPRSRSLLAIVLTLSAALLALLALSGPATAAGGRPFSTTLTGAAEVPGPADPDGSGSASVWVNLGLGRVCYSYTVSGVADLTAAHIHIGTATVAGPVVVPLPPTSPTGGAGCVTADQAVLHAILRQPSNYYINLHNAPFPAGALRGQLSRSP